MSIPLLLTLFYSVSFGNKTLRNVEGLKIYVVGLTWAIVTVLLPIIESESTFKHEMLIVFSQRFLFTIILILPFEIRDLSEDDKRLRTIPQKIGVQKTKYYGYLLLLFFCTLDYFRLKGLSSSIIMLCTVIFFSVAFAKERQSRYYSSFFVEGIPVLWYLLLLIF
jgi:4-hydroxybenzoate polyprenyltransferase